MPLCSTRYVFDQVAQRSEGFNKIYALRNGVQTEKRIDHNACYPSGFLLIVTNVSIVMVIQAMLAFVSEGAGIPLSSRGSSSSKGGASGSDNDGRESGGRDIGGMLELGPESLSRLEEEGVEALVVAFVKGGDMSVVPGWGEATNGLTGQVGVGL